MPAATFTQGLCHTPPRRRKVQHRRRRDAARLARASWRFRTVRASAGKAPRRARRARFQQHRFLLVTIGVHGRARTASEAYLMVTVSRLVVVVWVDVDMTSQGCVAPAQLALHTPHHREFGTGSRVEGAAPRTLLDSLPIYSMSQTDYTTPSTCKTRAHYPNLRRHRQFTHTIRNCGPEQTDGLGACLLCTPIQHTTAAAGHRVHYSVATARRHVPLETTALSLSASRHAWRSAVVTN